jgi:2-polyprenyl-3-methyl-5-hydroxy-6-metoxy-1,4-benzoquinol methylase
MTTNSSEFLSCVNCGLMVRREPENLQNLYRDGWKDPKERLGLTGGTTPKLAQNYVSELVYTLGLRDLNAKRILDFGGGRGEMARALEAAGAEVVIVDPYSYLELREKGLSSVESLADVKQVAGFDGAVAIDVIEHLFVPWEQLQEIKALLRVDGWLFISTPNAWGLNARLNRENWRERKNPAHVLLFTPPSLEKALQKVGFFRFQRLRWRVDFSENKLIQVKDWLLRSLWLDGVLRYLAFA